MEEGAEAVGYCAWVDVNEIWFLWVVVVRNGLMEGWLCAWVECWGLTGFVFGGIC